MYNFYLYYIVGVMFVLPVICILLEHQRKKDNFKSGELTEIFFKWFIFWSIGVRLFTAGLSQSVNPVFTASILQVNHSSFVVIRELGFANLAMGLIALISLFAREWRKAAALSGGLFLGKAGVLHILRMPEGINLDETIAMLSDLFVLLIVILFFIYSLKTKENSH